MTPSTITFLPRLVEATRSLKVGPAEDPSARVGPVIDAEAFDRVRSYIEIGRQEGREALSVDVGPLAETRLLHRPAHLRRRAARRPARPGRNLRPGAGGDSRGRSGRGDLQIANGTDYALTGGIFSRSPAHLDRASRELLVGNLYLNRPITGALVHRQPFGGFKLSGIGNKAGGPDYLLQFVVARTITENTLRRGFAPPAETT